MSIIIKDNIVYGGVIDNAEDIFYEDNIQLDSHNVQDAIDTLADKVKKVSTDIATTENLGMVKVPTDGTITIDTDGTIHGNSSVTEQTVTEWGFTKNTGNYNKPTNGIPKTDLTSSVQTSLGKADSALQSETDPTVPSYVKSITESDISNWNGKTTVTESTVSGWGFTKNTGNYSKPSGGIPKTDLASAVQSSLSKADTALQTHQDISGKSDVGHTHDDRYYTESEIDTKLNNKLNSSLKGANNGLAELDENGKVPSSQLPSFVDDVLEYDSLAQFPTNGESGKVYIAKDTNTTYRWGGSSYVSIGSDLALGETSSTAYRGDRGKTAYDHSQSTHARTDATNVSASNVNGNIKINGTETTVFKEVVLTQAEYDALPSSKLTDGVNYFISDATAEIRPATSTTLGIVKPDGTTITVDSDGTIHGNSGTYSKPSTGIPKSDLSSAVQSAITNVAHYSTSSTFVAPTSRDADTLGGEAPSYYATKSYVDNVEYFELAPFTGSMTISTQYCYKSGNKVSIKLVAVTSAQIPSSYSYGIIPQQYRPTSRKDNCGFVSISSIGGLYMNVSVGTDGYITQAVTDPMPASVRVAISLEYFI